MPKYALIQNIGGLVYCVIYFTFVDFQAILFNPAYIVCYIKHLPPKN
jgi:hypothetical protein